MECAPSISLSTRQLVLKHIQTPHKPIKTHQLKKGFYEINDWENFLS